MPNIQPDPIEVIDGESVLISCRSEAHPAPQLDIQLDGISQAISSKVVGNISTHQHNN